MRRIVCGRGVGVERGHGQFGNVPPQGNYSRPMRVRRGWRRFRKWPVRTECCGRQRTSVPASEDGSSGATVSPVFRVVADFIAGCSDGSSSRRCESCWRGSVEREK